MRNYTGQGLKQKDRDNIVKFLVSNNSDHTSIVVDTGMETGHPGRDLFKNEGSTGASEGELVQVVEGSHCQSLKQRERHIHAADWWKDPAGDQLNRRACRTGPKPALVHHNSDCRNLVYT